MKSIFAITTTAEKMTADNGKATIVFTVTNTSSESIRGVAKIKSLDNTQRDWLKLEDISERDFSANGTQQFTVNFNKPISEETQEAQSFPFRLDVISSANPDEDFTEGPTVNIETPEKKDDKKKPFPIWIPIVVGVLLLAIIGSVVGYLLLRDKEDEVTKITVPNVVNETYENAEKKLIDIGLTAKRKDEPSPRNELGKVFKQSPKEGDEVEKDAVITLSVPTKRVKVLDVYGKTFIVAKKVLEDLELKVEIVTENNKGVGVNKVFKQNPLKNKEVPVGTTVKLTIPSGKIAVPNVTGKTATEATNLISKAGFESNIQIVSNSNGSIGKVVRQNPLGGSLKNIGSSITIDIFILKAPTLLFPVKNHVYNMFPRLMQFSWRSVSGAKQYEIEIEYKSGTLWSKMKKDKTSGLTYTTTFIGAQPGRWRVWALDKNGVAGEKSVWQTFRHLR